MQVISVYPNFANKGGAQNVTIQLAKACEWGGRTLRMYKFYVIGVMLLIVVFNFR